MDSIAVVKSCVQLAFEIYNTKKSVHADGTPSINFYSKVYSLQAKLAELQLAPHETLTSNYSVLESVKSSLVEIQHILLSRVLKSTAVFGWLTIESPNDVFNANVSALTYHLDRCLSSIQQCLGNLPAIYVTSDDRVHSSKSALGVVDVGAGQSSSTQLLEDRIAVLEEAVKLGDEKYAALLSAFEASQKKWDDFINAASAEKQHKEVEPARPHLLSASSLAKHKWKCTKSFECNPESISISSDGTRVAFLDNRTFLFWNTLTGQLLFSYEVPGSQLFTSAGFIPHSHELVIRGMKSIYIVNIDSKQRNKVNSPVHVNNSSNILWGAGITSDGSKVYAGIEHQFRFWDISTGDLLSTIEQFDAPAALGAVQVSMDGTKVVGRDAEGATVKFWSVNTLHVINTTSFHDVGSVSYLQVNSSCSKVALSGSDRTIKVFFIKSGKLIHTLPHSEPVNSFCWNTDDSMIISGSGSVVSLWDTDSGELLQRLEQHKGPVQFVGISSDNLTIVSGGQDRSIVVWK